MTDTKIIVVTSGKGGVGKTTTAASIATGLSQNNYRTALIDFDIGLRNLDLALGCENRIIYDLINVIDELSPDKNDESDMKFLNKALIKIKEEDNLYFLAASQSKDKNSLKGKEEQIKRIYDLLNKEGFDYIICDSPAGIEDGALIAMYHADEAIVVVNPEISSIRDSDKIIGCLESKTKKSEQGLGGLKTHLLITKYDAKRVKKEEMLSIEEIQKILHEDVLGVIPFSDQAINYSNKGNPVINSVKDSKDPLAGLAYTDAVSRLLGANIELRHLEPKKTWRFWSA